jgi:hypothetical protein
MIKQGEQNGALVYLGMLVCTCALPGCSYDDMPRTQWIYKYSAQNTIVVTRTFFTQEVNEAFEELEEGEWVPGGEEGGVGWRR